MAAWIGPAISAGASLLGGILGDRSSRKKQEQDIATQREFAQHGVRWRVSDAQAAGIHPLFALGANVPSYSPTYADTGSVARGVAGAGRALAGVPLTRKARMYEESHARADLRLKWAQVDQAEQAVANSFYARERDAAGVPGDRPPGYRGRSAQDMADWYGDMVGEVKGFLEYLRRPDQRGLYDPNYPGAARNLLRPPWLR